MDIYKYTYMEKKTNRTSIFHFYLCSMSIFIDINLYILYYYIIVHNIYVCLHFHFNLKFLPKKITTPLRFQDHSFESCFCYSHSYDWRIAKNLDSSSSRVLRLEKFVNSTSVLTDHHVFQVSVDIDLKIGMAL
jgi:hypothetical protein